MFSLRYYTWHQCSLNRGPQSRVHDLKNITCASSKQTAGMRLEFTCVNRTSRTPLQRTPLQQNDLYNEGTIVSRFYCERCAVWPLKRSDLYNEWFPKTQALRYKCVRQGTAVISWHQCGYDANGVLPASPAFRKKRSNTCAVPLPLTLLENETRHATGNFSLELFTWG